MSNYKEHEARVRHFIDVRTTFLLIPPNAYKNYRCGLQGFVWERESSLDHTNYMAEALKFIRPGRVSDFMKSQLRHRLSREFITGWFDSDELDRETGILLCDLGIDLDGKERKGRFKFYSRSFGPEVERTYFIKYKEEHEVNERLGLPLSVDLNA